MKLATFGLTCLVERLENARRAVLAQLAFKHFLALQQISDAELKEVYAVEAAKLSTEFHAQHILVKEEVLAKTLIGRLERGEKFETLAKAFSKDPGAQVNLGDIGWFSPQALVPEFSQGVNALKDGETTPAPVRTTLGWHVIRRIGSRHAEPPPFESLQKSLRDKILSDRFEKYVASLKTQAKIVISES